MSPADLMEMARLDLRIAELQSEMVQLLKRQAIAHAQLLTDLDGQHALLKQAREACGELLEIVDNFTGDSRPIDRVEELKKLFCRHRFTYPGKPIPGRCASYLSEVCSACGAFRACITIGSTTRFGSWRSREEYADAVMSHKEEDV